MFDFDTIIDRTGTGACKWDRRTDEEKRLRIMPMSIADMEFAVAPAIRDAVVRAAESGIYGYTDPTDEYKASIVQWMRRRHSLALRPEDILVVPGVVPALSLAIRVLTCPGEGVIIQPPVYPPFYKAICNNARRIEENPLVCENGRYTMNFEQLEALASKPDVSLLLLCSPHNPVGRVWTKEELTRVADICANHHVAVMSDEIHSDLCFHTAHIPFLNVNDWARGHTIVGAAPSKTFNVPGLQTANLLIPNENLRAFTRGQLESDGLENLSFFGHAATIAAYNEGEAWLDEALEYIYKNYEFFRAFFREKLPEAVVSPLEGTYLAWVDMRFLRLDPKAQERFMRDEAKLILDEGYIFGAAGEGFERFNLALPRAELSRALDRLEVAYAKRFKA